MASLLHGAISHVHPVVSLMAAEEAAACTVQIKQGGGYYWLL